MTPVNLANYANSGNRFSLSEISPVASFYSQTEPPVVHRENFTVRIDAPQSKISTAPFVSGKGAILKHLRYVSEENYYVPQRGRLTDHYSCVNKSTVK